MNLPFRPEEGKPNRRLSSLLGIEPDRELVLSQKIKGLIKHYAILAGFAVVLAVLGLGVAFKSAAGAHASVAPASAAPAIVGVETLKARNVELWSEFSGRMHAVDYAEIRPEVSGRIVDQRFKDGQSVNAGDILLVIDPAPYQAAVDKAKAELTSAENSVALATIEFNRGASLLKAQWIARSVYDQRLNAKQVAQANAQAAEATLKQAQIDLDHAYVKAPISGRISRAEITLGNLVQAGATAPILTSIVSDDGIYADFEVDEQTYLDKVHREAETSAAERQIPVQLVLAGKVDPSYKGWIESFDNKIDTGSGTIRARARFENADGSLVPGMFVTVRVGNASRAYSLLVPERAVQSDQDKKYVYVIGASNTAEFREVVLGAQVLNERVVLAGLKAGDKVIVDGVAQVHTGAPVQGHETVAGGTAGTFASNH